MAHWKKSFPSHYMQVSDLDTPITATIAGVPDEQIGRDDDSKIKPVVHFREPGIKPVVLNITRCEAIEAIVGDPDRNTWPGHRITVFKGGTRYQGKRVSCISIKAPDARAKDDIDEAMPTRDEQEL